MKKFLLIAAAGLLAAACAKSANSSSNLRPAAAAADISVESAPQITDQELNNVPAPKYNYNSNVSYEDQLRSSGTYIRGIRGKAAPADAAAQ